MNEVRIFSPATVANVNCGFDVLGFALEGLGDEMILRKTKKPGIHIVNIEGAELPYDAKENVAGVAGQAMLDHCQLDYGFEIEIFKNIRLGSGVGSSAASAAGVVYGINQFLDKPLDNLTLTKLGMKGEAIASGNEHADNVAPCLFGGFTLITNYRPFTVVPLPVPDELFVTIIHPHITIKTKEARGMLPLSVPLEAAILQTGHVAGLVSGLFLSDYELIGKSTVDELVTPTRKHLIPHFDKLKKSAIEAGGLAFGISGSGPSMFTLCKGKASAEKVEKALNSELCNLHIDADSYVSPVSKKGNSILESK
ncbi:MAG: homoserine kinase [Leeuwenhoekiella sp.]